MAVSLRLPSSAAQRPHSSAARMGGVVLPITSLFILLITTASAQTIPTATVTALDGHAITLPRDLSNPATVLILGFGRNSKDATTAWEKPVRQQLAQPGSVGFYDMAMLAEVPGFVRGMVIRSVKNDVPDVLKPNFLPLTSSESDWKRVAGYDPSQPEAAYIMLVDKAGRVQWSTHAAFTPAGFAELTERSKSLASQGRP